MKNQNGFTLIEIIGVILMLSILALVAIPAVSGIIKKQKANLYNTQKDEIIESAKVLALENVKFFLKDHTYSVTLGQLKSAGYIDLDNNKKMKDQYNGCLSDNSEILITTDGDKFIYDINEDSGECAENEPQIKILLSNNSQTDGMGKFIDIRKKTDDPVSYTDPGYKFLYNGNIIDSFSYFENGYCSSCEFKIYVDGYEKSVSDIKLNTSGEYKIKYVIRDGDVFITSAVRNVIVMDN